MSVKYTLYFDQQFVHYCETSHLDDRNEAEVLLVFLLNRDMRAA